MAQRSALFVLSVIALALVGCAKDGAATGPRIINPGASEQKIDPAVLQRDVMSFCDRFISATSDAYDQLAVTAKTPEARQMTLRRKAGHAVVAVGCAADESPIVGLMDMMVMTRLVRQASEDTWFYEMFGEGGKHVITVLSVQEQDIWRIGAKYLTAPQLAELSDSIDRWRRTNPDQRYVAMVKLSEFPEARNAGGGNKGPGSVFGLLFIDPFASLDPAVREVERSRETVERMFFYVQRVPLVMSWQAQLVYQQMISDPEITRFVDNTEKFTASTLRFADATGEVAKSVKEFPKFMTEERERAVVQLSKEVGVQREAAVKDVAQTVATERDAALKQIDATIEKQRDAAIKQVESAVATQREAAIKQVSETFTFQRDGTFSQATTKFSQERDQTIQQLKSSIESQRQGIISDVDAMTNRILWRCVEAIAAVVGIIVVAALLYREISLRMLNGPKTPLSAQPRRA